MKVKNFRINIVFASSVSVLWALVYVPEGLPIGTLSTGSVVTSPASSLYEPQQFLITSGIYSSAASNSGTNAGPLRVWSPLARNLNPGDGIFFIWRARERLRSRNHLHFQLRVLCELIKSAGLITCNTKPSPPRGALGGLKKGAKRLGARRPGAVGSRRVPLKRGNASRHGKYYL